MQRQNGKNKSLFVKLRKINFDFVLAQGCKLELELELAE